MNNEDLSDILLASYEQSDWWEYVQDDVRNSIQEIIHSIGVLGPLFRNAYIDSFRFEHSRRMLQGVTGDAKEHGPLFGKILPEEVYQSGIFPTKLLLNLNDWVEPNDADVRACMILCQQIEVLQAMKAIPVVDSDPSEETNDLIRDALKKETD